MSAEHPGVLAPSQVAVDGERQPDQSPETEALALESCMLRHVSRLSRAIVAAYDPALARHGLTGHQFNLMTTLHRMGPMSVGDLASALGMDPSGVPRAVRPLIENGLLSAQSGQDRRRRMLAVTSDGATRLHEAQNAWEAVQRELVDHISPSGWLSLAHSMRNLRKAAVDCSTRKHAS